MTLLKSANDSLSEIFIRWVHTNTVTHTPATNIEICNHVLEGKKSSKALTSTHNEEKPHKVLIVESFEADGENAQYANFKYIVI